MDNKLIILSSIFFVVFLAFAVYLFSDGSIARFTRADISTDVSLQKSLLFAWPLSLPADGSSESEVTVFVRNEAGDGLPEHPVKITSAVGQIREGEQLSDADGKAIFHISSDATGVAEIEAFVNNKRLLRKITVRFN
ncbi:MAG: Ig-like domain-containing protein [Candidatus Roizmanbacteria bacterium]|nr:Ig-like domain-containing protein [Candidatus Roizmanbacteria bacterium]